MGYYTANRENESDELVRANGPVIVRKGPLDGPTVLVLDPAGDAKHYGLPATWRAFAEHLNVVWWRLLAASRDGLTVESVLAGLGHNGETLDVVSHGSAAELGLLLAAEYPELVRSVVLVDPEDPTAAAGSGSAAPATDLEMTVQWCDRRFGVLTDRLAEQGTPVEIIADDSTDDDLPPLPIGHPEVVATVVRALVDVTAGQSRQWAQSAETAPSAALGEAWTAAWELAQVA
ncbi:MAG TPA: hypothetical protein VHW44_31920 [Pseudonocardiaceae bacterium]|jgi:pimeloyl-ACP methyl ester carboxylesterase|nr:hypothetical protein [Pseudonocardiaceae bacterium]